MTHNALGRVASREELLQFVRDVEKAALRQRTAQNQRMRAHLAACRVPTEVISLCLRSGLLPRIIEDTHGFHIKLLETLRSTEWEFSSPNWKGSCVDEMARHHATELGQIRVTATDHRMHLLESHVCLRNAHKEKFQDPSFTRALLHTVAKNRAGPDEPDEPKKEVKSKRCSHCKKSGVHTGNSKDDCPLKMLTSAKAKKAMEGLTTPQCKAVHEAIKDAFASNASANPDEAIESARASVQSSRVVPPFVAGPIPPGWGPFVTKRTLTLHVSSSLPWPTVQTPPRGGPTCPTDAQSSLILFSLGPWVGV